MLFLNDWPFADLFATKLNFFTEQREMRLMCDKTQHNLWAKKTEEYFEKSAKHISYLDWLVLEDQTYVTK